MNVRIRLLSALLLAAIAGDASSQTWATTSTHRAIATSPEAMIGFASSIALQGNELYVGRTGAAQGFPMPPTSTGSVHVFTRNSAGTWVESLSFSGTDVKLNDGFGSSLAVDGSIVAVGAPASDVGGAVYVFEKKGTGWVQVAKLSAADGKKDDDFGRTVTLKGGMLAIGAPARDSSRGAIYVSSRNAKGGWSAPAIAASGTEPWDGIGTSITFDGGRALVGVPGPLFFNNSPDAPKLRTGAVAVYRVPKTGTWMAESRFSVPEDSSVAAFGRTIVVSGIDVFVSAPLGSKAVGSVFVFARSANGEYKQTARLLPSEQADFSIFGRGIAVSGDQVIVGAPGANQNVGAVYVFKRTADGWAQSQLLTVPGGGPGVRFGHLVRAEGSVMVAAGPNAEFFEGLAYGYARDGSGEWKSTGTISDKPTGMTAVTGGEVKCKGGKADEFSCSSVDLLSFLPTGSLGAKRGIMLNDLWGWTDEKSGREFGLIGRMDGTVFVEVTDPQRPVYLGELPMHEGANANMWRDIKVYKDHAFIVADGSGPHGVQVFDLTQLLDVQGAPVTFKETAHYDKIASAHNIAINESTGFAYTIGNSAGGETCGGALHMINIQDLEHPVFAGCFADPSTGNQKTGYTHDSQCVTYHGPDTRYTGREICFNASETAVGIADVTDKGAPKPIAVASYPNTSYAHQGWLSEDQAYFFLDDEGDEISGTVPKTRTIVWDVSKLDEPVLLLEFLGTTSASDHNLYIKGNYMYQSDYVAGLRVIDVKDPKAPKEVGFFDTVPVGENVPGFAGSWSNYPFFKSGTVLVTSMREGLFVLKYNPQEATP
jgi:choice-of-anchor B domain-containing protein